ncbi:MAG: FmdB family zinc ribbon protein [Gemmatimonadota bacterium]
MPIYEYSCRGCGNRFEQRLRYDERLKQQTCPQCGATQASLCMSVPSLVGGGNAGASASSCQSTGGACGCGKFPA